MWRLGTPLPGLTRKSTERRPYPPGVHGAAGPRRKSPYRTRLEEKQKLRFHYGVSERQLRRYFARASRQAAPAACPASWKPSMTGRPQRTDVPIQVDESAIVEFYAR